VTLSVCAGLVISLASDAREQLEIVHDNMAGSVAMANAQSALWELRYGFPQFMVLDAAGKQKIVDEEPKLRNRVNDAFKVYAGLQLSAEEREAFEKMKGVFNQYMDARPKWFQLMNEGKLDEAREWRAATTTPFGAATVKAFLGQAELQVKASQAREQVAINLLQRDRAITLGVLLAALLSTLAIMFWSARAIMKSIGAEPHEAAAIADRIAAGDLTQTVTAREGDRSMMAALQRMQNQLRWIVGNIRNSSDSIRQGTGEITAGNQNLSQRTEEQASALEETSASMQQMTATVGQNAQNARKANELAAQASGVAAKGGEVVREAVGTMNGITQSSKKIADIIGVIDGIAFQTNILALNAAVEAARAGEQGRGFAVVASEVRSLAQRSAAAAKEIKDLITDSVAKVDAGSRQVNDAGRTMEEIVSSVKSVTGLISEITAASQEQAQGIEQVSETMTQLEKVTQQNAAMVEEASAAAASLEEQAIALTNAVAAFRLPDAPARPPARLTESFERPTPADNHAAVRRQYAGVVNPKENPAWLPS
jgi:methyl-accepting chemotaxis protein